MYKYYGIILLTAEVNTITHCKSIILLQNKFLNIIFLNVSIWKDIV